ncbi:MAG: cbb3-type cytochrome c oxidase subunit 3 [candidate division Zixibacteria bacterium]|nr:cbb3-type cytochrome c oxidase subunit 3 [candidate division Zixibacteria bacterium]
MIKDVLQSIASVEIYPIISLLFFVVAFLAVALRVLFMDKAEVVRISRMPLDEKEYSVQSTEPDGKHITSSGE